MEAQSDLGIGRGFVDVFPRAQALVHFEALAWPVQRCSTLNSTLALLHDGAQPHLLRHAVAVIITFGVLLDAY